MDRVMIQGLFRPTYADSLVHAAASIGWQRVRSLMREDANRRAALSALEQQEFRIEVATDLGFVASASPDAFSRVFGSNVVEVDFAAGTRRNRVLHYPYFALEDGRVDLEPPTFLGDSVYALGLPLPAIPAHDAAGSAVSGYGTLPLRSILTLLPMDLERERLLPRPEEQVHVALIDSGFTTRVQETLTVQTGGHVITDHEIRPGTAAVIDPPGVPDIASISGRTLAFTTDPGPIDVTVEYCCIHPAIRIKSSQLDLVPATDDVEIEGDDVGHGVGVAANLLAVAPDVHLTVVKYVKAIDAGAALLKAYQLDPPPDIINCSWVAATSMSLENWELIETHLASAAAAGTTVVASTGGIDWDTGHPHTDAVPGRAWPLTHPSVISVGGAALEGAGTLEVSEHSNSFASAQHPYRRVPDVVGIMAGDDYPEPFRFPTQPDSLYDDDPVGDGWSLESGTSTCSAQVAGVAARVLEKWPNLSPLAVKNVLMLGARDIGSGLSLSGEKTGPLWDPATGWGIVGKKALSALTVGFAPQIRQHVGSPRSSWVRRALRTKSVTSPDVVVLRSRPAEDWLGITTKHRDDLSDPPVRLEPAYVYVRVDNRGDDSGSVVVTVTAHRSRWFSSEPVGSVEIADIGAGEFVVSEPIVWFWGLSGRKCWLRARLSIAGDSSQGTVSEAWTLVKPRR